MVIAMFQLMRCHASVIQCAKIMQMLKKDVIDLNEAQECQLKVQKVIQAILLCDFGLISLFSDILLYIMPTGLSFLGYILIMIFFLILLVV